MTAAPVDAPRARRTGVPSPGQGLVAAAVFAVAHLYYGRGDVRPSLVAGTLTFVLLMVQLRLVDDLDDLDRDLAAAGAPAASVASKRRSLWCALAAVVVATAALNAVWPPALAACAAMTVLAVLTPKVKRFVLRSRLVLFVLYESAPALAVLYTYVSWRAAGDRGVPAARAAGVVALLWVGYEFWKFSRKHGMPVFQPYDLSVAGVRRVLYALLAAGPAAALLAVYGMPGAALALPALVTLLSVALAALVTADRPARRARPPSWGGLVFLGGLATSLFVATLVS
ncbi:hypothetical protein [Actinomadura terrae]|uniref:hypothetical protein n=1 Tax=Actinomadura terrae TaxID=604353 RepID=UPI001FA6D5E6|nr:hypothetical protein [Actinomadura terrae]